MKLLARPVALHESRATTSLPQSTLVRNAKCFLSYHLVNNLCNDHHVSSSSDNVPYYLPVSFHPDPKNITPSPTTVRGRIIAARYNLWDFKLLIARPGNLLEIPAVYCCRQVRNFTLTPWRAGSVRFLSFVLFIFGGTSVHHIRKLPEVRFASEWLLEGRPLTGDGNFVRS
jgi:hypothetical protein